MSMPVAPDAQDVRVVEELLRALGKTQRALQMYLPNNPIYRRSIEQLSEAFAPAWSVTGRLVLEIEEQDVRWEGQSVLPASVRGEGLAWQLYKDGLRRLTLLPGVEDDEIIRFLEVVNRARLLPADASDDLLTLLWEQEFVLITYAFIEVLGEGLEFLQESPVRDAEVAPGAARDEVAASAAQPPGMVDLSDNESTVYFLDEAETRFIRAELEEEYRRDIRRAAIDALLDVLETQRDAEVRREVVRLLEDVLPTQLAHGGFSSVAHILRELRSIVARSPGMEDELHQGILAFEERLSQPEMLEQLFRILDEGSAAGQEADVGLVLRELKPSAVPHILAHLGQVLSPDVRRLLEPSIESLVRAEPRALAAILEDGPDAAIEPAIGLVGRLRLAQLAPGVIRHLKGGTLPVRLAAVRTLAVVGTPSATEALEATLLDEERTVRQAGLEILLERGTPGLRARLEAMLFGDDERDWERTERRALFEAYGQLAGSEALPRLQALLEPKGLFRRTAPAEIRACAIFALARVGSLEARVLVDKYSGDKEAVVRSAANTVLREWRL
ncbi:MAG TPA: hypothetical protein VFN90_10805 [Gemmatimonadales bacterium]|nr:hypothetical protein [Gemmatimonadales bacterium]